MTSLIETLHQEYPDAMFDVLVKRGNESVLVNNPKIRQVAIFDKRIGKLKGIKAVLNQLSGKRYDWVINCHRFLSSGIISQLVRGRVTGFRKNPVSFLFSKKSHHDYQAGIHELDRNFRLISHLVKANKPVLPRIYPSNQDKNFVDQWCEKPFWILAPASVWFTKQYPKKGWLDLIRKAGSRRILLIGGPDDFDLCQKIVLDASQADVINLAGKLTLMQSAALIQKAQRCFANDSAPTHLASAVNAPVTTLFCSTTPDFGFGPLSLDSAVAQTNLELECRPCGIHGKKSCPVGHFKCADFTVDL